MGKDNQELDEILKRRVIPPAARDDLAARIIAASLTEQRDAGFSASVVSFSIYLSVWLETFLRNFLLPRPALAFGIVLMIGLALGVFLQDATAVTEEDYLFLYLENSYDVEDWL